MDHGKSSLASRVLEFSGISHINSQNKSIGSYSDCNLTKENIKLLDTLSVERERGNNVKASAASTLYKYPSAVGKNVVLLLNTVDIHGHVDFGIEVTRSLAAVQGAFILFDSVNPIECAISISEVFGFDDDSVLNISAREKLESRRLWNQFVKIFLR